MVGVATKLSASDSNIQKPPSDPNVSKFVYLLALMAVIGGFLFGYDTGIVSSAMLFVINNAGMKPVTHLWQEMIVAITPAFAAVGSIFAGFYGDQFGRKKLILLSSVVFTLGAIICGAAWNKWILLIGRTLLGGAIGVASMIVPVYISECSPTHVRGKLLTGFNMMVCFGQMAANIVAGGFSYIDEDNFGWRLMFGFAAIPAFVQFLGFLFLPESPRWLFTHQGEFASREVLTKVYDHNNQWVDYELAEIASTHKRESMSSLIQHESRLANVAKVFKTPHIRKAVLVGASLQFFQQLAGINTVMYYTGALIKSSGIKDNHTTIWLSCVTSFVNFVGNIIPFYIVERLGRRKTLLASTLGVAISLILLGGSFHMINRDTMKSVEYGEMEKLVDTKYGMDTSLDNVHHCLALSNCDYCVSDDRCGFCHPDKELVGVCLPISVYHSDLRSSTGFCSSESSTQSHNVSNVDFKWSDVYCKTKYTLAPLILMVIYLLVFSAGFASLPWVLNAEFYPLWARSTCVSISTFANWSTNLIVSMTFLSLTSLVTRFGTFYLYAGLTFVSLIIFWKYVPETKDCSIDEVEQLFMSEEKRALFRQNLSQKNVSYTEDLKH